jgi:hypothetical protein
LTGSAQQQVGLSLAGSLALPDDFDDALGDVRLLEPGWADGRAIEFAIGCVESSPISAACQR